MTTEQEAVELARVVQRHVSEFGAYEVHQGRYHDNDVEKMATGLLALAERCEKLEAVYRASVELRRVESTDMPGESIAELEANAPAAQRRTALALTKWRSTMDEHLAALDAKEQP